MIVYNWQNYMMVVSKQIEKSFEEYDTFFKRNGLNFEQVCKLFQTELKIAPSIIYQNQTQFLQELPLFELDAKICELGIIGPTAIKDILISKGHKEIIPFYKYINSRFSN